MVVTAALVALGTVDGHTPRAAAAGVPSPAMIANLPTFVVDAHRAGGLEVRENSLSGMDRMLASGAVQVLDLDTQEAATERSSSCTTPRWTAPPRRREQSAG